MHKADRHPAGNAPHMDSKPPALSGQDSPAHLVRALRLRDLILFGIVLITPVSPMPIFGISSERGGGHVVTGSLIALIAMLFTGISYGRMARAYPSAGSAFTYVAREINPNLGFLVGWSLTLDYIAAPICAALWCAQVSIQFLPQIPVWIWQTFYTTFFTYLNVQGIRTTARFNIVMTIGMGVVIGALIVAALHYMATHPSTDPRFFTRPFYDARTFTVTGLLGVTSLATLNYIGFDAISTLSEEARNPRRDILLATILTCLIIAIVSGVEVYLAQLVWPVTQRFPDIDTAYVWVAARIWAPLFTLVGLTLLIANAASGMASHLGASRLLYAMGRSNALPSRFFGNIDPKTHIPRTNVLLIGAIVWIASLFLTYRFMIELVNFGALTAYLGVNGAAFLRYYYRSPRKTLWNFLAPAAGFAVCLLLLWGLTTTAKIVGLTWSLLGVAFALWRTQCFRTPLLLETSRE